MTGVSLRDKIGYLIYRAREEALTRADCLDVADAILLVILATPDSDVEEAIAAAIPSAEKQ